MYYQINENNVIEGKWEDTSPYIVQCLISGNINCDLSTELNKNHSMQQSQADLNIGDTFRQATQEELNNKRDNK